MNKSSAELIATNEDLLMEILLRLPVKPLLTFKRVSKQFLSIISSPYFCKKHTIKNANLSSSGLFLYENPDLMYLSLEIENSCSQPSFGPFPAVDFFKLIPYDSHLTILSSCNGLLLCLLLLPAWHDNDITYFVVNPSTRKINPLPPLNNLAKRPIVNIDLAYDPKYSVNYKVICMRHSSPPDGPDFVVEIYSSESGSWRSGDPNTFRGLNFKIRPGIQFQGGIYANKRVHYMNPYSESCCYFNIEDETMRSLRMPTMQSEVYTEKRAWQMGQSGGHLHLVDIQRNITRHSPIDIYEVMDDYSGWVLKYSVDLDVIGSIYPEMVRNIGISPLAFEGDDENLYRVGLYYSYSVLSVIQKDGDEEFMEIVLSIPHKIICYNPRNNKSKVLAYFGDDNDRLGYEWKNVYQYTENLLPV